MKPYIVRNVLSEEQVVLLKSFIEREQNSRETVYLDDPGYLEGQNTKTVVHKFMGRLDVEQLNIPKSIMPSIQKIADDLDGPNHHSIKAHGIMAVEYSGKYGRPVLRSHKDGGDSSLMINYQLESNTSWDLCIDDEIYTLGDNDALVMDPVRQLHSRVDKTFAEGEFLKMVFFRFGSGA
jgi:hypothetical protein